MFNMQGEVIGIASFILNSSKGYQGLGFAATSNIAQKLLCEDRALWTGIDAYLISGALAEVFNLPQESGLLIQKVAGLSFGDLPNPAECLIKYSYFSQKLAGHINVL